MENVFLPQISETTNFKSRERAEKKGQICVFETNPDAASRCVL